MTAFTVSVKRTPSAVRPAIVSAACLLLWAGATAQRASPDYVTVNFATDKGPVTYGANGFLHPFAESCWGWLNPQQPCPLDSSTASTRPAASLVDALKIRTVRLGWSWNQVNAGEPRAYARATSIGATVQLVLSDFAAPGKAEMFSSTVPDTTEWRTFVTNIARQAKEKGWKLHWDVWNEPNNFKGSMEQFYEIWRIGVQALRSVDPGAVVVGPSVGGFAWECTWVKSFLLYAKSRNVLPDILSWHYYENPYQIPGHVQRMREVMDSIGVSIKRISLNEVVGHYDGNTQHFTNPGLTAKWLAAIERSGVESACHACWGDTLGTYNCNNNSLNGLLTIDGTKSRAAWWVYKGYADITGRLVGFTLPADWSNAYSYPTWVDGVVGQDSARKEVRGVFGRFVSFGDNSKVGITLQFTNMNSVPYLGKTGKVRVRTQIIPNTGTFALAAPSAGLDTTCAVSNNTLLFTVPNVGGGEAFTVLLTPEGGTAVAAHPLAGAAGGVSIDAGHRLHLPTRAAGVSVRLYSVSGRLLSGFRSQVEEGRAMDLGPRVQKAGGVAVVHVVCYDADGRGISDAALVVNRAE